MTGALRAAGEAAGSAEYEGFIGWVLGLMVTLGEVGVGAAVLIETFVPPIPSEAVLPGAGFLAYAGQMNAWVAIFMATLGAVVGAWVWWYLGLLLGRDRTRAIVDRIPLMDGSDFDRAEAFFARWGKIAVLGGRCVPLVRSFISIPAGIERMPFWSFTLYTVIGSGVWNSIWIGLGYAFGPAIEPVLARWSGVLSDAVLVVIGLLVLWFLVVRLRARYAGGAPPRHGRRSG
ncbi:DedA family protein [Isoptericola sp. NEAU-Y5]|uniref:DedA family protein n=1 Tax=Isoptericola luteus TaxID=2879484 RepID=A0ABS7ZKE9_9MICO|nr:DedA family protein [Isoptericola sp. NEAU-Y5]MCA5894260.1 DedA family protein [Isoptericola sp. NEAU-Y5]